MRILGFVTLIIAISGYSSNSFGEISVSIVDAPGNVLLYSPVRITGVIENIGNTTEAVSLTDGWGFEMSKANEYLPLPSEYQYDIGEQFIAVLLPGEKYYISEDLGGWSNPDFTKEGVHEVRIFFSGTGRCIPSRFSKPYALERDVSASGERGIFKCWQGKVYSQPVKIAVEAATSKEDLEVLEFVKAGEAFRLAGYKDDWAQPYPTAINFSQSYEFLLQKYPNNHYTFVAGLHNALASGNSHLLLKQLLDHQPSNPLRRYALVRMGMRQIDFDLPLNKEIETELQEPVKKFLKQYQNETESLREQINIEKRD